MDENNEIEEMKLYIEQLEAENSRLKNSIRSLRNNNKSMLQGLNKLQSYVSRLKRGELQYDNYWVSLLIQDDYNSQPRLIEMQECSVLLKNAMKVIDTGRKNYRVLAAWIDCFDKRNTKTTVFHECFIDICGNITK